jgi:hypothetical protein
MRLISRLSAGRIGEAYTLLLFFCPIFIIFVRSFQRTVYRRIVKSLRREEILGNEMKYNVDKIHVNDKSRMRGKENYRAIEYNCDVVLTEVE